MELLELATKLVSFDTVSSRSTQEMSAFISGYLGDRGFRIEEYPYEAKGVKKFNLIARKGGDEALLVLAGHMDTVPAGEWSTHPWTLTRRKDAWHGLGIADMKFFLAVAMKAAEAVPERELKQPLALCFTSDEEVGCLGAKKLVEDVRKKGRTVGRYVVIGEPTKFQPVFAHKGYIYLEVVVEALKDAHSTKGGKDNSAHSSDPSTTTNAVEKTLPSVIEELCKFKRHLEGVHDGRFRPDYPTMNIAGDMRIGRKQRDKMKAPDKVAKNIIPRGYAIECDIRPVPGQDPVDLINILDHNIKARVAHIKTTVPDEKFHARVKVIRAPTFPMETAQDSPIISLAEAISGKKRGTVPFNTEGDIFNRSGCESLVWGPSDILQAHHDNECVAAELFHEETVAKYVRLIRAACVDGGLMK